MMESDKNEVTSKPNILNANAIFLQNKLMHQFSDNKNIMDGSVKESMSSQMKFP